ncbi:transposase, MuDR, plant [Tanacetum coccineum]
MASSSSSSSYLIRFHRGGVFVSDPFSYDYEILSEIPNVEMDAMNFVSFVKLLVSECSSDIKQIFYQVPGLELKLGLRTLKTDNDLAQCVEVAAKNDNVVDIYVSHSVFDFCDATSSSRQHVDNVEQNDASDSDLDDDDYNIYEYDSESEESDTASVDHLSDGEEEIYDTRTRQPDPKPKKMFDDNFLSKIYNGLPRDEFVEKDVSADKDVTDKDNIGDKFPIHDPTVKWKLMRPVLGEKYESPDQLKRALAFYALANGYKLYYEVNNPRRLLAKCCRDAKDRKCPFRLWASWMQNERSFQIKKLNDEHSCSRTYEYGTLITSNWIARNFAKKIMMNPCIKVKEITDAILKKYKCKVGISQARRGKMKALEQYETCLEDHYGKLWSYAAEILNSNPGSTCKMSVDSMPDGKNYFSRFYVCFKALKDGWLQGCRRVIGIDGCFLKTICKGELLSAVGRDGNNQIYPIAWAVELVRNNEARQNSVMPMAEHDKVQDDIMLTLGRNTLGCCIGICSGKQQRQPILQCLRSRLLCMEDSQRMREKHEKWNDGICPNIKKKLEKCKDDHRFWKVIASGQTSFEVRNGYEGFKVNERARTCTCRGWQLSGIPCVHGIAAIYFLHKDPENYVSQWYNKEVFVSAYNHFIQPMNGMDQWPSTTYQKPLPPIKRRMPGRPPHKRKRDAMEDDGGNRTRISRKGQIGHCFLCKKPGHNQRSCPTKTEGTTSVEAVTGTGEDVTASVGNVCASGGMVTARGGSVTARGGKVTARGGSVTARGGKVTVRGGKVTASGGNVSASGGIVSARGGNASIRGGKVSVRGGKVSARGGKVSARGEKVSATPSTPDSASIVVSSKGVAMQTLRPGVFIRSPEKVGSSYADTGSSSMNGLRTVNGKVVSSRGRGDGSKSRMYPHGIRPIGFGVSWDPIDGQTMLGDSMGIPRPAWPEGITPQDCIIEAATQSEIAISQSPPVESQEQEAPMQEQPVQEQPLQEQPVQRRPVQQPVQRKSERIAQILFNKPPKPGPGLDPDDAISIE